VSLNIIRIIPYNNKYVFNFVEEKESLGIHPVSDYYLKTHDLSLNLYISLK
jgi:hypothetical protein